MIALSSLMPGDWIEFIIGWNRVEVYVVANQPEDSKLSFCSPRWLYTSAWTWSYREIMRGEPIYLGRGKWKWWVVWQPEVICPYRRPNLRTNVEIVTAHFPMNYQTEKWRET